MAKLPKKIRVAIVGADESMSDKFSDMMRGTGYAVAKFSAPFRALQEFLLDPPSLVLLHDSNAKGLAALCEKLRSEEATRQLPVLGLCPKASPKEVASVLDAGADDCLARPLTPDLVMARVRALLRRARWSEASPETSLKSGPLELCLLERAVRLNGRPLELTRLEFELLAYLLTRRGQAVKRSELLESIWNYPPDVETRTLDKHVESLRKKLEPAGRLIETVRAVGYRIKVS